MKKIKNHKFEYIIWGSNVATFTRGAHLSYSHRLEIIFWDALYNCHIHIQGVQEKVKKSNHLVWYKNKVEFLFLAHQLRGNMCPFCLITLTKPCCRLFWSKVSMQKIRRNAKKWHFRPILVNWLHWMTNCGLFWPPRRSEYAHMA